MNQVAVNVTTLIAGALGRVVIYMADVDGRPDSLILRRRTWHFLDHRAEDRAHRPDPAAAARTYWIGIRHSSTATLSAWALTATPDLNGGTAGHHGAQDPCGAPLAFATAAPATWGFMAGEISGR